MAPAFQAGSRRFESDMVLQIVLIDMKNKFCMATADLSEDFIEYLIGLYFDNASEIKLKVDETNRIHAIVTFTNEMKE